MLDILSWSKIKGFECELRGRDNSSEKFMNSYYFLKYPKCRVEFESPKLLMILHGTGNDAWFPQVHLIEQSLLAGYAVVALNLPGHGLLDCSTLNCDELETFLAKAIDDVIDLVGNGQLFLWGHSIGAATILKYLANSIPPSQLKGATLVGLPFRPRVSIRSLLGEIILPALPNFWTLQSIYGFFGAMPAIGRFRRRTFPVRLDERSAHLSYMKVIADWFAAQDWIAVSSRASHPILVIHGRFDQVATRLDAARLHHSIAGSEFVLSKWDNHFTVAGSRHVATTSIQWMDRKSEEAITLNPLRL